MVVVVRVWELRGRDDAAGSTKGGSSNRGQGRNRGVPDVLVFGQASCTARLDLGARLLIKTDSR